MVSYNYQRRGRTLSRQTTRPYRRAATRTELAKLKRVVQANRLEVKQFTSTGTVANIFATATQNLNLAGAIGQGAGTNQRLGREVRISRLRLNVRYIHSGAASTILRSELIERCVLVKAKQQTFNVAATGATVLLDESQSWRSEYLPDMVPGKYAVIGDKTSTKTLAYAAALPEPVQKFDIKFTTPHKIQWSLDTDDIIAGGLYAIFACNQGTDPTTAYYQVIVDYTD